MNKIISIVALFTVLALPITANAGQAMSGSMPAGQTSSLPAGNSGLSGSIPQGLASNKTVSNLTAPAVASVGSVSDNNILKSIGAGVSVSGSKSNLAFFVKLFTFKF